MRRAVAYELARARLVRPVGLLALAAVVTGAAMAAAYIAMARSTLDPAEFDAAATSTLVMALTRGPLGAAAAFLIGAVLAGRDLRNGAVHTTLTLFPRRQQVFAARLVAVVVTSAATATATLLFAAIVAAASMVDWSSADLAVVLRCVAGHVLSSAVYALWGAASALTLGSTGLSAAAGAAWFVVVEPGMRIALGTAGAPWASIAEFLPVSAASAMSHSMSPAGSSGEIELAAVTPVTGALVSLALVGAFAALAWRAFRAKGVASAR